MSDDTTLSQFPKQDWGSPIQGLLGQSAQNSADAGISKPASTSPATPSTTPPPPLPSLFDGWAGGTSAFQPNELRVAITDFLRNNVTVNGASPILEGSQLNFTSFTAKASEVYPNSIGQPSPSVGGNPDTPAPHTPNLDAMKARHSQGPETTEERNQRVHEKAEEVRGPQHQDGESVGRVLSASSGPTQSDLIGFMSDRKASGESDEDYKERQAFVATTVNMSYSDRLAAMQRYKESKGDNAFARLSTLERYKILLYSDNKYITLDSKDSTLMMKDSDDTSEVLLSGGTDPQFKLFDGENSYLTSATEIYIDNANQGSTVTLTSEGTPELILYDGANTGKYGPYELYLENANNSGATATLTTDDTPELILYDGQVEVKLDIPDNEGTKLNAFWQEIDVCVNGVAKKMQVLGTEPYAASS